MPTPSAQHPLRSVPDPQTVRAQLGRNLRESQLLRRLLRLAQDVDRERTDEQREAVHAE
jgi:hypothetical protein